MCPDFVPNRGNLVSEQRYDDGDVCDNCIKSDRVVRALEHQIEDYKFENSYLKKELDRVRGMDAILREGSKMIKNFIGILTLVGTIVSLYAILANMIPPVNPNAPIISIPITILIIIITALGYSIYSSDFIELLVRMYIVSREGK